MLLQHWLSRYLYECIRVSLYTQLNFLVSTGIPSIPSWIDELFIDSLLDRVKISRPFSDWWIGDHFMFDAYPVGLLYDFKSQVRKDI